MRRPRGFQILALGVALAAGCFYITIKFPVAEVEAYATKYVRNVYAAPGDAQDPNTIRPPSDEQPKPTDGEPPKKNVLADFFFHPVYAAEPSPSPQEKPVKLDVSSPAIQKIQAGQKERLAKMKPLYEKGTIGIGKDGNIMLRDAESLSLKEKTEAGRLVKAENDDRAALYREIAVANDIATSEVPRIQKIFAKKWIDEAPAGWWYQDEKDRWIQKKKKE